MVKCPKCGSNMYDVEYIEETNRMYDHNYDNECVTQTVKVTCCCGHQFSVQEKFIFVNAENID